MTIAKGLRPIVIGAALALFGATASQAQSSGWSAATVHVTVVEASYMPTAVTFEIDQTVGTCTAGTFLSWNATGSDSTQLSAQAAAVLSLLLTAKVTNQPITIWGLNSHCLITYIHLGTG